MRNRHHNVLQRIANATVILAITGVIFVNRRIQKWITA